MRNIIRALSVIVMMACAFILVQYVISYKKVENDLQQAQQTELEQLQQQNDQIIGWLSLEGTRLDNPVLQADNNDYYLSHNYLDEKSRGGSIFVDYRNQALQDKHTIFYGHVLRNGTMFGELANFAEQSYAEDHLVFYFEFAGKHYALQVFAAYETTTDHYYIETQFTDETFTQFIQNIQSRSVISMPIDVTVQDKIVTFSTCTTSTNDKERFVVHAKVVEQEH
ncbi:class B sortase [Solibacillus sp. FSL H8-0523]|uniref:class B sortase n=1 Tax=Solibacillus sp. FSL H8-0523 TaxID=2954511 RepID=UPI00310185B9